jgi:hypothetical protein
MGKMDLTEAERNRRSELARELHGKRDPLTGRRLFGGPQPGAGRPPKRRATEIINEKIEEHALDVWDAMYKALKSGKPMIALQAARQMVEISKMETDIQAREEKNLENTSTEELVELVASRLARLSEADEIRDFIDGYATEETEHVQIGEGNGVEDEPEGTVETGSTDAGLGTSAFARRTPKR